jgi:hypothetical protein
MHTCTLPTVKLLTKPCHSAVLTSCFFESECFPFNFGTPNFLTSRIRLIESNAKSLCLKSNLEKDFVAAIYFTEISPLRSFCLGVVQQFCTQWIWSHTECKSPAWSPTPSTPPFPATHCIIYLYSEGGRMLNLRECRWTHPGYISKDENECFGLFLLLCLGPSNFQTSPPPPFLRLL